ncbi:MULTISPECIES: hypothetical protein [unclassified Iodidimonas]|uniref:hypothetical protein n=1 Tax=unclassified Iodidimonas TaxID=2626145 RepID=UPI002482F881|nr:MULTISPECIES: hypothetical protein [unclassified Iodidimonas]
MKRFRVKERVRPSLLMLGLLGLLGASSPAMAAPDCGDPPSNEPKIPVGKKADRDLMLKSVNAVRAYSESIDEWLACKDRRAVQVFSWMNEDQRKRWEEDLNSVHERRVEVQRQMNEAIREFNAAQPESTS